jgi:hypothetical protein
MQSEVAYPREPGAPLRLAMALFGWMRVEGSISPKGRGGAFWLLTSSVNGRMYTGGVDRLNETEGLTITRVALGHTGPFGGIDGI